MLADLDLKTLTLSLSLVTLMMTLLLGLAAWHAGSGRGLRHWALGNLALMFGLMLNVNQTHLHHTLSILLANGLMTLGLGLVWLGIRAFFERTQPQLVPLLATLLIIVLLGVFRYQFDSNAVRYAISSVILGGLCLLCASELLRPTEPPLRSACWFSGAIALLYGLMLLARPVASLLGWNGAANLLGGPLQLITLLGAMAAQIGMATGFILMTHYRNLAALHRLSERDGLTDTLNRRSLHQQAGALLARMQHGGEPVTLIMVDADHFKRINDEFGHQTGDAVLCHLVNRISQHLRNRDLLGRFGGEEFTLLLPGLDSEQARPVAERIRHGISQAPWRLAGETISLTASLGVACSQHHGYDFNTLLGAADAALYRAKTLGRNRVELAPPPGQTDQEQVALRLLSQFSHNLDV